ncbi:IS1595 family transposase [Asticcacaulis taihuensis]|uniref:IS1595 family transposase n=1 Tax=Asticcacaulis taihuensis TaxID=260084 RepID=UPI0026EDAB6E|nr:IS1595 family transposase [Asticcacaulis taihuensis]
MSILSKAYFHDEAAAFAYVESVVWANGMMCPHCGGYDRFYDLSKTRVGLKKCGQCRKQFTVRVGTVFESSHIPLHKWLQATYLMVSSKKGISAHQLGRVLEITYKSAWFMAHRLREAMRSDDMSMFGGEGAIVEVDETFIGIDRDKKPKHTKKGRGYAHKHKVLSLVDRSTGRARSMVVDSLKAADLMPILQANIAAETHIMTDEAGQYHHVNKHFAGHDFTSHGKSEYVRGDIHTNTIEGFFSIFKRGMKGVYQHCAKKHLNRYLAEFDFRYNNRVALGCNDSDRQVAALMGVVGKRLTYRGSNSSL